MQFGDSRRALYGVYHAPQSRQARPRAVVLCNPFGEEAVRAFRIYRLLAERLAEAGAHVLRFDYYGTGDSAGDCAEADLGGFADSILEAQTELLDISGARDCAFVGLRLGAAAAVLAAARAATRPALLVLWDPIVSGRDYLHELAAGHRHAIKTQTGVEPMQADPPGEALGFLVSPRMANDLAALNLAAPSGKTPKRISIVAGARTDRSIAEALGRAGAEVTWREDFGEASWNSDQALNAFVVPARTLEQVAEDALS